MKWSRRFERYRVASGLKSKPEHEQVITLLYAMGDCADDILATLRIDVNKATYFDVRRNLIVQRARINRRRQLLDESVDAFIQDLYRPAEDCEYGSLKDGLIRDRIVVGVLDDTLSDRLQAKADLTFEHAVPMSRQSEAREQRRDFILHWKSTNLTKNQQRRATPDQSPSENECGVVDSSTDENKQSPFHTVCLSKKAGGEAKDRERSSRF